MMNYHTVSVVELSKSHRWKQNPTINGVAYPTIRIITDDKHLKDNFKQIPRNRTTMLRFKF